MPTLPYSDRRTSHRNPVSLEVSARLHDRHIDARTLDLSEGGMCLELDDYEGLEHGQALQLDVALPGTSAPLQVEGEVRWTRGRALGIRFRKFVEVTGVAALATFLAAIPADVGAKSSIPEFDPDNFTVDMNAYPGNQAPDEQEVIRAFENQFSAIDVCVAKAKRKRNQRIKGFAEMKVLLNPSGDAPLGLHSRVPEPLQANKRGRALASCLRTAIASAEYPKFRGPPVVAEFEFEIDPGEEYVPQ